MRSNQKISLSFLLMIAVFYSTAGSASFQCRDLGDAVNVDQAKQFANEMFAGDRVWKQMMNDENLVFQNHNLGGANYLDFDFSPVKDTYLGPDGTGTEAIFRVGYEMPAQECRRQIIFDDYAVVPAAVMGTKDDFVDKSSLSGWLAVDVCLPGAQQVFAVARAKGAKSIKKVLEVGDDMVKDLKKKDATKSKELKALMDQLKENLSLSGKQKDVVFYFTDENGLILPRFKVRVTDMFFSDDGFACYFSANVHEDVNYYASIINRYEFQYYYDESLHATVLSFDASGNHRSTNY